MKGTVYFTDGHVEKIRSYHFINDSFYRFSTASGDYLYKGKTFIRIKIEDNKCGGIRTIAVPAYIVKIVLEIKGGSR